MTSTVKKNYLFCPACRGTGRAGAGSCSHCRGAAVGLNYSGLFLYWGRSISAGSIVQERFFRLVKLAFKMALLGFGISGVIILGWQFWRWSGAGLTLLDLGQLVRAKSYPMFIFWLSLLADLYLFYLLNRDLEKEEKIKEKHYQSSLAETTEISWEDLSSSNQRQQVDVSLAYGTQANLVVERAYQFARQFGHRQLNPIHLLTALLTFNEVGSLLARLEITPEKIKEKVLDNLTHEERGVKPVLSPASRQTLVEAYKIAYGQRKQKVGLTDVLVAANLLNQSIADIFYDLEIDFDKIKNVVMWADFYDITQSYLRRFRAVAKFKPQGNLDRAMTAMATPFLNRHSRNLTTLAKYGYFSPCLGRDKEIEEIFRAVQSGRRKGIILVGETGVGKTAIIRGLAQRMATEDVPDIWRDKRLVDLSIPSLIGGAAPDVAQSRLIRVLNEITQAGNIVLVLENIRELLGISVGGEESLELAEILVQVLAGGGFYCLATTTPADYARYIERSSLVSVFQPVRIEEPDKNSAIQILEIKSGAIENKHQVYFSYKAIARAVDLADRFIPDRYLPDKAINILEEAAVLARQQRGSAGIVRGEDVAEIVAQATKIPVQRISQEESQKLLDLEQLIHQRIVGQAEAVKMVAASLRRARAEMRDIKRPISNFLFLGPTGVGKTELAKTIAEVYFGSEDNMIRLDMSEYQAADSINRLIGQADSPGLLTEAVRQNPFSIILLDEIEKADRNIINIFLQVMEDGRLTDGVGRVIDFTNSIIIATSNAGTEFIQDQIRAGLGVEQIRDQLVDYQLKDYFRPEFLNRFDGIIVFRPLNLAEVEQIARLMIDRLGKNLSQQGVSLEVTAAAIQELAQAGFNPTLGARPLRRVIQEKVADILTNYLLENKLSRRDVVVIDAGGVITVKKAI
ncbi:MAG TPA: ATP-dependent Clp protease ATP-binding subunit [bacterium]|nr:ATP-dependent Clp protease ATP-binding subunit [bacterium]